MAGGSQTLHGKALEWHIATALSNSYGVDIEDSPQADTAFSKYEIVSRDKPGMSDRFQYSAEQVVEYLKERDPRYQKATAITIQEDNKGRLGDPRDVILRTLDGDIGISAKNGNSVVKNPRLSSRIDWGKDWGGYPCSEEYRAAIAPIFKDMAEWNKAGLLWKDVEDRSRLILGPLVAHFEDELHRLYRLHDGDFIDTFFRYLIGGFDHYKVEAKKSGVIEVMNININGHNPGTRWEVPQVLESVTRRTGLHHFLYITFDGGWSFNFRLHTADGKVGNSVKWDIQHRSWPSKLEGKVQKGQKTSYRNP